MLYFDDTGFDVSDAYWPTYNSPFAVRVKKRNRTGAIFRMVLASAIHAYCYFFLRSVSGIE